MSPRRAYPVHEFVDDQSVLILERRRHAEPLDARNLKAERDDERRVDRGREQCLEPRQQLVAPHVELLDHSRAAIGLRFRIRRNGSER